MPYVVYLPPDYDTAQRRYPVLYMLHGRGGSRDEWLAYGLAEVADELIRTGAIEPMIIVVPQGDTWYWTNNADDGPRWGDYVDYDLVPHVDANYRTLRSPQSRAIGGLSMGGWGALYHGFSRPDVFGVVGAHSPSLRLPGDPSIDFLGNATQFAQIDPITLAQTAPNLGSLQIWLDTAEKDPWRDRATLLHNLLAGRGIQHTWQVYPGQHDWTYWHEHAVDYLKYYGHAMERQ